MGTKYEVVADDIYADFGRSPEKFFRVSVIRFLHLIAKILIYYLGEILNEVSDSK